MSKPVKPSAPKKPYPPDKNQKVNNHSLDIDHLLFKDKFYMPDPNDESKSIEVEKKDWDSEIGDYERDDYAPSFADIMKLCPFVC